MPFLMPTALQSALDAALVTLALLMLHAFYKTTKPYVRCGLKYHRRGWGTAGSYCRGVTWLLITCRRQINSGDEVSGWYFKVQGE